MAAVLAETSVHIYQDIRSHITLNTYLHCHCCENLKSYIFKLVVMVVSTYHVSQNSFSQKLFVFHDTEFFIHFTIFLHFAV